MSPEEIISKPQTLIDKYINLTRSEAWRIQRSQILNELKVIRPIRNTAFVNPRRAYVEINKELETSTNVKKVLVAEIFPDETTPLIFTAWNVSDDHDVVRDLVINTHPDLSGKTRISGEVVILKDASRFFLCDPIMLSTNDTRLPTQKNYLEVAEILLDQGYIPVDAEFNILPITSS